MAIFYIVTVFYSISHLLGQQQKSIDLWSDRKVKTLVLNNTHSKTSYLDIFKTMSAYLKLLN